MIKVMLVEDQRLFREGVNAIINTVDDIEVVGMVEDGRSALQMLNRTSPDVVLMDIHMPALDGINATVKIKEQYPNVKVVMLTTTSDEELVIRGINVGADGFLLKNLYADNLVESIRNAARGQAVLSGEIAQILVDKIRELTMDKKQILGRRLENYGYHLTNRELDIAYQLMNGHSNKSIAKKLYLGEGTVKNYISEIYDKLQTYNRNQTTTFLTDVMKNSFRKSI
ncbi:response regulator transcription factor [Virgibacillus siamensis]|uniref:response regulator transcription factor n=1 Tax=Virgibacillus siamensis TaxID=480071 RepID=UPI0009856670|nr:response regulator transcription factor [Virgibacillus siamensis]